MIYVYQLPDKLSDGYCFGAGRPITFTNVDWFEGGGYDHEPTKDDLISFIQKKRYYKPDRRFLVIGAKPEHTFTIDPVASLFCEAT